jgi:hypothetical protein
VCERLPVCGRAVVQRRAGGNAAVGERQCSSRRVVGLVAQRWARADGRGHGRECWPKLNVRDQVGHGRGRIGLTLSTRSDLRLS